MNEWPTLPGSATEKDEEKITKRKMVAHKASIANAFGANIPDAMKASLPALAALGRSAKKSAKQIDRTMRQMLLDEADDTMMERGHP